MSLKNVGTIKKIATIEYKNIILITLAAILSLPSVVIAVTTSCYAVI